MIRDRRRTRVKDLRLPTLVLKSDSTTDPKVNNKVNKVNNNVNLTTEPLDQRLDNSRSRKRERISHLCVSERGPRPKQEREWSPMSNRDEPIKPLHQYGRDGLYSKHVDHLYQLITRQNSIILPPVQTSRKMKKNVFDDDKLREKKYVMKDFFTEGKMSKFARDQCFLPSVYPHYLKCKTCRKSYTNDKYIEDYKKRNQRNPYCSNALFNKKGHFCDVLGKRYCSACIESENRKFSKQIEDKLVYSFEDTGSNICFEAG